MYSAEIFPHCPVRTQYAKNDAKQQCFLWRFDNQMTSCHLIERTDACLFRDMSKGNFCGGHRWMTYITGMSQKHLINSAFKCMLDGFSTMVAHNYCCFFFFKSAYLSFDYTAQQIKWQRGSMRAWMPTVQSGADVKKTNLLENTMNVRIRKCPRATTLPLHSSYTTFPAVRESHVRLLIVVM